MARRILIVEDEHAFAEVLVELLQDEGYSVVHVRDGISALNMLASKRAPRTDLILCDVMLPVLRGDRLAVEVRRRFPRRHLPILLMSASADPRSGLSLSGVEFIGKPFETSELLNRIDEMLASQQTVAAV